MIDLMVIWYVTAGAGWDDIGRLSAGWGNASEIALARRLVSRLGQDDETLKSSQAKADPGLLYWEIKAEGTQPRELVEELRTLWSKYPVLGLTAREGVPSKPDEPAVACRAEITDTSIEVRLSVSHPSGSDWVTIDRFKVKLSELTDRKRDPASEMSRLKSDLRPEQGAAPLADALAEAMVARLVRVTLSRGPRVHGKESFRIKIINDSPLILNGLAISGLKGEADNPPSLLAGISLPPLKSMTVPASADIVHQLRLKEEMHVVAVDLSGL
jgi:hypothetical protein